MALCYAKRAVPAWDAANIARLRCLLHAETIRHTDMREALHEFQYIPTPGQMTELGVGSVGAGTSDDGQKRSFWAVETSIERRNLRALLWGGVYDRGTGLGGASGLAGVRNVASGMFQTSGLVDDPSWLPVGC